MNLTQTNKICSADRNLGQPPTHWLISNDLFREENPDRRIDGLPINRSYPDLWAPVAAGQGVAAW